MKIEILFPEFCNLYGDMANMRYLEQCLPEAEFIRTPIEAEPSFVKENVNLIYLGSMTESMQEKVISKLKPHKEKITELIDNGTVFLFTGNAMEVLEEYIENEDGSKIEALGIFQGYAKRDMLHRYFGLVLGETVGLEVVGFKTTFSFSYHNDTSESFINVKKGIGQNKNTTLEGIRRNNFIGTYLIGPLLILNPLFTKYLLELLGVENPTLKFEKEILVAYETRLKEFKNPDIKAEG